MAPWLVAVLVLSGVLLLICTAGGIWTWYATAEFRAIADLPESERAAALSKIVRRTIGDTDKPLLDLHAAVADGRYDDAFALTSDGFRAVTPRESFAKIAESVRERFGRPVEILVLTAKFRAAAGIGGATGGSCVDLTYQASFEKGKGTISATLEKDASGAWRVHGWRVDTLVTESGPGSTSTPTPTPTPDGDTPK